MKLTPAIKGGITGLLMIVSSIIAFNSNLASNSPLHYTLYLFFGAGIIWTLLSYKKSPSYKGTFGEIFNQGFKCFIVAVLLMAIFTYTFDKMHPRFADEHSKALKENLIKENKKTLPEIEDEVKQYHKNHSLILVFYAIFGNLIIGAGVTAIASLTLTKRTS